MSEIENKEPEEFKPAFTPSEIGIEVGEPVGGFERETLDDAFEALSDERYVVFGHGTNHEPTLIMTEGLNSYHHELAGTAVGVDMSDIDTARQELGNWEHLNAKDIVLLRFPKQFAVRHMMGDVMPPEDRGSNVLSRATPLFDDGIGFFRDRSFEPQKGNGYKDLKCRYDKRFIFGAYDARTDEVILNPEYASNLDDPEQREQLEEDFAKYEAQKKDQEEKWDDWMNLIGDDTLPDIDPTELDLDLGTDAFAGLEWPE